VLLSSAPYVRDEHRRLARSLNDVAEREGLPLTAKLAAPRGYEKIHAKGVVVDGERVVLGSLNWNPQSVRENREVLLVLEGERIAGYYARVFDADWGRDRWPLPPPALATLGLAVLGALAALRRIDFGRGTGVGPPDEPEW
jgi:phosphatidylserine/phosphatidylglycerophosphate/cardiolipin synthase-like enzyme